MATGVKVIKKPKRTLMEQVFGQTTIDELLDGSGLGGSLCEVATHPGGDGAEH